jgi:EAL domain-containing protein (putative c-di-GMP-specific phosphodiesterase class I)
MGVQIAVDDFGTGYSSLSYLNQFPIDVLKIDQSFVRAIDGTVDRNGAIVGAVISMGKNLQQRVIAEGVEEEGQFDFLKAHECNEGQGYWFSHPVDAARMQAMLGAGVCS